MQPLPNQTADVTAVVKLQQTDEGCLFSLKGNLAASTIYTLFVYDSEGNWDICKLTPSQTEESVMPSWDLPCKVLLCQNETPLFYGSTQQEAYTSSFYALFLQKLEIIETEHLFTEGDTEAVIDDVLQAYNDLDSYASKTKSSMPQTFFEEVLPSLTTLFQTCPRDELLEDMVHHSKWIRAYQNNDCLLVGIIYKNNLPQFVSIGKPVMDIRHYTREYENSYLFVLNKKQPFYFGYELLFLDAQSGKPVFPLKSA